MRHVALECVMAVKFTATTRMPPYGIRTADSNLDSNESKTRSFGFAIRHFEWRMFDFVVVGFLKMPTKNVLVKVRNISFRKSERHVRFREAAENGGLGEKMGEWETHRKTIGSFICFCLCRLIFLAT